MPEKPLVSFVVFSFMQEHFIREAVLSALAQTYQPLEILITDDCSTDSSFDIIKNTVKNYHGPHKVFLNRNVKNIGLAESINRAWKMTKGELIVVQGGDDISLPERASESVTRWTAATPRPDLVYSNVIFMDTKGEIDKIVTKAVKVPTLGDIIQGEHFIAGGMAAAYSRQLIEESRPLDSRVIYEDVVLTFRALVGNGIAHIAKPLVKYRRHENSIMAKAVWPSKERYVAQQRARHKPAEKEDRLETWLNSETSNPLFTWRLKRELAQVKLDAYSCMASRRAAILCCLWAIATLRPKTVSSLFIRDVLRI